MIAKGAVVAIGGRDHHGRAVEIGVLQLPRTLAGAGGQMHVDEGGFFRGLGIAIGGGEDQGFRQQQNRLHPRHGQKGVKKSGLGAARVGKGVFHLLRHQLMHQ